MPRLIKRNRALRKQDTATVQEWLDLARRRGHTDAVLSLELELVARGVFDDAPHERRFAVYLLDDQARAAELQLARLQRAVQRQSIDEFRDGLRTLCPSNFAAAWALTRDFTAAWDRAAVLRQVAFWISCYFRGYDEAVQLVTSLTAEKSPVEVIRVLETEFAGKIDEASEVQDA
jgi:hypothetical protein